MCFGGQKSETKPPAPPAPPPVLSQPEPVKKTVNAKDANSLAIGTKMYQNNYSTGLSDTSTGSSNPSGFSLNK